jgi:IS5 family transposase
VARISLVCAHRRNPHKPYEFGVKVSVATTLKRCKGGQFAIHAQALPRNHYDGDTLGRIIPAIEQLLGNTIERLHADAGYRGHNAPPRTDLELSKSARKRDLLLGAQLLITKDQERIAVVGVIDLLEGAIGQARRKIHVGYLGADVLARGPDLQLLLLWNY